ncbi:SUMF1/EgtB/PvdO family nonheme iron enzyme [Fuerstiella marisgermanici]|nr:SUMF1/EgtB/PvdO family nonheme iron enzyme [Fuerstiella marisgermanici]
MPQKLRAIFLFAAVPVALLSIESEVNSVLAQTSPREFSGRRVAIVMGNSAYQANKLKNPVNDAVAIAKVLKKLKFEVKILTDLTKRQMIDGLSETTKSLEANDLCVVYYAGHGMQVGGENYLVPLNAKVEDAADAEYECLSLQRVMAKLDGSECSYKVVILDCCRNNPFRAFFRAATVQGLNHVASQPDGTIITFSTKPGAVASDGSGNNSPYTMSLVETLEDRPAEGLEVIEAFRTTARKVKSETGQRPYIRFDGAMDRLFLTQPTAISEAATTFDHSKPESLLEKLRMRFVKVPAGTFQMGSEQSLESLHEDFPGETYEEFHEYSFPRHRVSISKPFEISAFEVTVGQFRAFVEATGYETESKRGVEAQSSLPVPIMQNMHWDSSRHFNVTDKYPVTFVTWGDAQAFCKWLSVRLKRKVRLPTQAEWEYACRAGTQTRFSFGDDPDAITHFANVPGQEEIGKFALEYKSDGGMVKDIVWCSAPEMTIFGGGESGLVCEPKRGIAKEKTDAPTLILNNSNRSVTVNNRLIGVGKSDVVRPVIDKTPPTVYLTFGNQQNGDTVSGYPGELLNFHQEQQQWRLSKTELVAPSLSESDKLRIRNSSSTDFFEIVSQGNTTRVNPGQTLNIRGRKQAYWSDSEDGYPNQLAPVGQFEPNAFGLYDMHGNVWEWCQDGFDLDYTKQVAVDPKGSRFSEFYAIRGGCYI